jgi:hypothetical protein
MKPATVRKHQRGSAMIELSITVAVFVVPVMLYSNYISEALWYGLKAQEATSAAAWSFSGRLLHDYQNYNHMTKYSAAAISVRKEINGLYKGLDAWAVAGENKTTSGSQGIAVKAQLMASSVCDPVTNPSNVTDPSDLSKSSDPLIILGKSQMSTVGKDLHTGGLIACQTQVQVTNWLLGKATGQNTIPLPTAGAPASANNLWPTTILGSIQLCGVGSAVNSSCQNTGQTFTMFTDDWGLAEDGDAKGDDDQTNYEDYNTLVNNHFANLGQIVYEHEALPIAYDGAAQTVEAQLPEVFCSSAFLPIPIDDMSVLDKQYFSGQTPHNAFNLAYKRGDTSYSTNLALDTDSPENTYEGGSYTQTSYTWPNRHYAAGVIGANAYQQMEKARNNTYLAQ